MGLDVTCGVVAALDAPLAAAIVRSSGAPVIGGLVRALGAPFVSGLVLKLGVLMNLRLVSWSCVDWC
jgi:hypothetical protein